MRSQKQSSRAKQSRKQPAKPQPGNRQADGPSQLNTNIRLSHRYRFTATAAQNGPITDTNLLGVCGGVGSVVNSQIALFTKSVKVRKIEIWSAPASQGANSTCSVDWEGFGNSPNVEVSDTTVSVTKNAHVVSSPPPQSLCSFWQEATGTNLFTIVCPANSIIDLWLDEVLADQTTNLQAFPAVTAVVGRIYYLALDGTGTHNLVPVSLTTTF